jgi:hypothetical protein
VVPGLARRDRSARRPLDADRRATNRLTTEPAAARTESSGPAAAGSVALTAQGTDAIVGTKGGHSRIDETTWDADISEGRIRADVETSLGVSGRERLDLSAVGRPWRPWLLNH